MQVDGVKAVMSVRPPVRTGAARPRPKSAGARCAAAPAAAAGVWRDRVVQDLRPPVVRSASSASSAGASASSTERLLATQPRSVAAAAPPPAARCAWALPDTGGRSAVLSQIQCTRTSAASSAPSPLTPSTIGSSTTTGAAVPAVADDAAPAATLRGPWAAAVQEKHLSLIHI